MPIVPVVFSSYRTFLSDEKKILNPGEVIIEALPEIPTIGLSQKDVDQLITLTKQKMSEKFTENTKEIEMKAFSSS